MILFFFFTRGGHFYTTHVWKQNSLFSSNISRSFFQATVVGALLGWFSLGHQNHLLKTHWFRSDSHKAGSPMLVPASHLGKGATDLVLGDRGVAFYSCPSTARLKHPPPVKEEIQSFLTTSVFDLVSQSGRLWQGPLLLIRGVSYFV